MRLIIQDTADDASRWTARHIADRIRRRQRESDAPFVLGLPTDLFLEYLLNIERK